jgi:hypothetical protein
VALWTDLPPGRVVSLVGLGAQDVLLAMESSPPDAPAVVALPALSGPFSWPAAILDELDACARALFPAWLPGAEGIASPAGLGVAAVRAVALRSAAQTPDHGPFLADLAARSLGDPAPSHPRFPDGVRAAGLGRVIAASYHRPWLAVVLDAPPLAPPARADLDRLAFLGGFGIWLASASSSVSVGGTTFPPVAGRPHPWSLAEQALEAALAGLDWATGRAWNQTYDFGPLVNPVRLDLLWRDDRCVVEIDGPEHCAEPRYEADRRRDVDLQLAGYAVLRFTNAQVQRDLSAVLDRIERFLRARRSEQKG